MRCDVVIMGATPYVHAIVCVIEGIRRQRPLPFKTCRLCNVLIQGVVNDATVVVDGPACEGWSAIMGQLTVAGGCTIADSSTTIAMEATWDWWWELAFLAFLWSRLFLEEEGPSSLLADDESAPFC